MASPTDPQANAGASTKFTEDVEGRHAYVPEQDGSTDEGGLSRHGTLRKSSLSRKRSLGRSGTRKSRSRAGSLHSLQSPQENRNSVFYTPIPTQSNPTEILANRFSAWRKILKGFIEYFREVQASYEARARSISKITHALHVAAVQPPEFMEVGGILETNNVLRDFHKEAIIHSEGAARIESDVINSLIGLRSDLNLKIKEIKALSGDFKSNVEKEKEATRKEVLRLQDSLTALETNPANASGNKDPYILRLSLEKQLKRQLAEENYLHRAYLNLEHSGRELESIVVGEVQKAFDTYVKIVRREGEELFDMADRLTASTLRLPAAHEWDTFVERDANMVDPSIPLRVFEEIEYPGCRHPAVLEIRSGMMERKSKYLKSFTPGWYVLSPTHLHEFKSSVDQTPIMSLYLPDSSLGKHSEPHATSHKFMLRGRQTGHLHRGHSFTFRLGSHQEMLEWFNDIKKLTEASAVERNNFVADVAHRRTLSNASRKTEKEEAFSSDNEDAFDNDEADAVPYSGQASALGEPHISHESVHRPEGGRFPSDIQVNRGLEYRNSTSGDSSRSAMAIAAASALPGAGYPGYEEIAREDVIPVSRQAETQDDNTPMSPTYGASAYPREGVTPAPDQHVATHQQSETRDDDTAARPHKTSAHLQEEIIPVSTQAVSHGYDPDLAKREADGRVSQVDSPATPTTVQPTAGPIFVGTQPRTLPEEDKIREAQPLDAGENLVLNEQPPHGPATIPELIGDLHVPGEYPKRT